MVNQGSVNHPALVVQAPLLLVLLEEVLLISRWCPFWYGWRYYRVGRVDEGSVVNTIIFLGWKDEPKIDVLASSNVDLDQRCVRCQELVVLLDGGVVRLACMLG